MAPNLCRVCGDFTLRLSPVAAVGALSPSMPSSLLSTVAPEVGLSMIAPEVRVLRPLDTEDYGEVGGGLGWPPLHALPKVPAC